VRASQSSDVEPNLQFVCPLERTACKTKIFLKGGETIFDFFNPGWFGTFFKLSSLNRLPKWANSASSCGHQLTRKAWHERKGCHAFSVRCLTSETFVFFVQNHRKLNPTEISGCANFVIIKSLSRVVTASGCSSKWLGIHRPPELLNLQCHQHLLYSAAILGSFDKKIVPISENLWYPDFLELRVITFWLYYDYAVRSNPENRSKNDHKTWSFLMATEPRYFEKCSKSPRCKKVNFAKIPFRHL
jgi:hypothetical protein